MVLLILFCQLNIYQQSESVIITNIPKLGESNISDDGVLIDDYDHLINYYSRIYNVDPFLVKLIIQKESQFNPRAVSKSGAMGLMQLMPETAKRLGINKPFDPAQNIEGGIRFLRSLLDMFNGDLELTLAAYHAGPGIVKRLKRVPPISETIAYVDYIISRYGGYTPKPIYFIITETGVPLLTNRPK
jgi:soluble lytic murein transglycosylase-like protein|uniref:Lytic transglycosylase domain-containing protein n=1 Tax=candidate division WOR-3 bacterium TaxID=2052148 RepID=A0A7C4TCL4_UNCW3